MTFEHRHDNKSCSACRDRVNETVKVAIIVKMKVFQNIPGSQLLSDIQTLLIYIEMAGNFQFQIQIFPLKLTLNSKFYIQ